MKRIYIETDLEGISGVDTIEMMDYPLSEGYKYACRRLMADVNAAVEGALAGGADEVYVSDGHGGHDGSGNFIKELLHEKAIQVDGSSKLYIEKQIAGVFCIGYHAMAGTPNAFLDHTQASRAWFRYKINGREIGEIAQCAMNAGHYKVPVLLVTGDAAVCQEARSFFQNVETTCVKHAINRNKAQSIPLKEAELLIRQSAKHAMSLLDHVKPYTVKLPAEHILELFRTDWADIYCKSGNMERIDAYTVRNIKDTNLGWGPW